MQSFSELAGSPANSDVFCYVGNWTKTNTYLPLFYYSAIVKADSTASEVKTDLFVGNTWSLFTVLWKHNNVHSTIFLKTQIRNVCDFQVSKLTKGWSLQLSGSPETDYSSERQAGSLWSARASGIWNLLKFQDFVPQVTLNRICIWKRIGVYVDVCWFSSQYYKKKITTKMVWQQSHLRAWLGRCEWKK